MRSKHCGIEFLFNTTSQKPPSTHSCKGFLGISDLRGEMYVSSLGADLVFRKELYMFDSISERFQGIFRNLRGIAKITESNIQEPMREIRKALLEADVNYKVAKTFMDSVKQQSLGSKVLSSISPGQQIVKIVSDEMVRLMDQEKGELNMSSRFSAVMLVGLQGSGKTTTAGKLARFFQSKDLSVMMVAADTKRLAARQQFWASLWV